MVTRVAWVWLFATVGIAAAVGGFGWNWWNTHWPPRVYDRELARIGPPVRGARPQGGPLTDSGSVTGIDSPLSQAQSYTASGQLSALAQQAAAHLASKGYQLHAGPIETMYKGVQNGPPLTAAGYYELSWYIHGHRQKIAITVEFRFHSDKPFVPVSPDNPGTTYLPAEPVPPLVLTPENGSVIVSVTRDAGIDSS